MIRWGGEATTRTRVSNVFGQSIARTTKFINFVNQKLQMFFHQWKRDQNHALINLELLLDQLVFEKVPDILHEKRACSLYVLHHFQEQESVEERKREGREFRAREGGLRDMLSKQ
jgi:hypothetical protein